MTRIKKDEYFFARNPAKIRNNQKAFKNLLSLIDWGQLAMMEDVNECVCFYTERVNEVIEFMAPLGKKKVRKKPRVKLPEEVLKLMRERDDIRRQKAINPTPQIERLLRKIKGRCRRLIYKEQMKAVYNLIREEGSPAVWKIINENTKAGKRKENLSFTPKQTNKFFINKVKKLNEVGVDRTLAIDPLEKLKETRREENKEKLVLKTVQESKVKRIIQALKSKTSSGQDNISSELLKIGGEILAAPLTYIINKSIVDQKFPDFWKEAIVQPLHKKGSREELKNFRPVSLLCVSGMILEAVVKEQIEIHLESNNLLGEFQFGYRRNKSTATAVNTMVCTAKNEMNKGKITGALMFDMSAAFDTVEMETVSSKLKLLGASENAVRWIKSYLSDRSQKVRIGEEMSTSEEVSLGTPQGSRLSPLLFNILTCDLDLYMKNGLCCNFADDTSISGEANTKIELQQKLERDAEGMAVFTSTNNLVLNASKTAFICKGENCSVKIGYSGSKQSETEDKKDKENQKWASTDSWTSTENKGESSTSKEGTQKEQSEIQGKKESWTQVSTIEASKNTELLGMKIQGDLNWDCHIEELKRKLRQRIGLLKRLRHVIPKNALKLAAEAIFTSKLRYGIASYLCPKLRDESGSNVILKELTVIQNDMLRAITGKKLSDHKTKESLRKETKTMSVNQICVYHIMLETYGILKLDSSPTLKRILLEKKGNPNARLRSATNDEMLQIPVNENRKNAFNYYAASAWNAFQSWKKKSGSEFEDSNSEKFTNECILKRGLGLECDCITQADCPGASKRELTEKEKFLRKRKERAKSANRFKKDLKVWIREEIPQE